MRGMVRTALHEFATGVPSSICLIRAGTRVAFLRVTMRQALVLLIGVALLAGTALCVLSPEPAIAPERTVVIASRAHPTASGCAAS